MVMCVIWCCVIWCCVCDMVICVIWCCVCDMVLCVCAGGESGECEWWGAADVLPILPHSEAGPQVELPHLLASAR